MPSSNYAYVNGRFVPETQASVSIFDRGFLYGDGVFETMRVYGTKIFKIDRHLQRLCDGLEQLQFEAPVSQEELRAICIELAERNEVVEGFVRVHLTRGAGDVGLPAASVKNPTVVALAQTRDFEQQHILIRAITSAWRVDAASPLSRIKTANRAPYVLARLDAARAGAEEAVMLNNQANVAEFTASNLFAVKDGQLFTPALSDGPLPGITRDAVLMLAAKLGIPAQERSFDAQFLEDADEIFATNSLIEIIPLAALGRRTLPSRAITLRLREAYRQLVREELK